VFYVLGRLLSDEAPRIGTVPHLGCALLREPRSPEEVSPQTGAAVPVKEARLRRATCPSAKAIRTASALAPKEQNLNSPGFQPRVRLPTIAKSRRAGLPSGTLVNSREQSAGDRGKVEYAVRLPEGSTALKAFPKTATILLLLTSALPALAGGQYTVDAWRKGLREIDQKLRAHEWAAAEKQSRRLGDQIIEEAGLGESAAYTLAVASAFRAIAEAGQGHEQEADWHWATALNLFPDIAKTDLSPYGPPAAGLKARQPQLTDPHQQASTGAHLVDQPSSRDVKAPRILQRVPPSFPEGLRLMRVTGEVVVESIIGEDGVPFHPRVLQAGGGPAMQYEALEALRQWRFEPARLEGRPVKVYYVLTITFALKR